MVHSVHGKTRVAEPCQIDAQKQRLRKACQEFESIMNNYMLRSMRQSVIRAEEPEQGREMYESMMDETLAGEMSRSGSQGLSELLFRQLAPLVQAQRRSRSEG